MNTVFIVPTGIGSSIGGHAGDANPAFKLIASVSNIAITHPNVVNASSINEMPDNTWYVEGSILDKFLEGKIKIKKPKSNKILLAVNKKIRPETINAVNAAKYTIGCEIEVVELKTELKMVSTMTEKGASGEVYGWKELVGQIASYDFDALAIASSIDISKQVVLNYFKNGGVNPYGGVEAVASKLIANEIGKPVAHAPIESNDKELKTFNEVVNPRLAAEMGTQNYIHSVFKGLHKAPRIDADGLSVEDIDCLITPLHCYGRAHKACEKVGIPIVAVRENKTCLDEKPRECIVVENYLEAAGYVKSIEIGITKESVSVER